MYDRWDRMVICSECIRSSRIAHERGGEDVWDHLPVFFELESWAELKVRKKYNGGDWRIGQGALRLCSPVSPSS